MIKWLYRCSWNVHWWLDSVEATAELWEKLWLIEGPGKYGPKMAQTFLRLSRLSPHPIPSHSIPFHPIPLVYLSFVAYLQILHIWQIPMAPSHGIYTHFIFYVSGFLRCQIFWGQENMSEAISFDAQKCCEQFIHMRICFKGLRMAKLLPWCQVDVPTELEKGELTWINMFGRPHGQTRETLPCFEMIKLEGRERESGWTWPLCMIC